MGRGTGKLGDPERMDLGGGTFSLRENIPIVFFATVHEWAAGLSIVVLDSAKSARNPIRIEISNLGMKPRKRMPSTV
ncbi:uncharacterized protein MYCFIDRAFT_180000 [Pseudocercospora fijiensis CIRAD86]|uniref:Uncharacterized protein n=1 Tax=Pseudocercospora fijiensis (strain CIRAD86) TaxID=383855 RepID=M3AJT5_PSEFD|nr:uncharacterized protein MYCFIDRAFT_180000 [Pseudocercospora fijiensis CIRAD86]EME77433.1 hypothetical protein MYCFIDRAFT_180000 [Pseudocercospora fijiensis CIRAD86]